ncbi:MAG: hypothetical protein COX79_04685 [Candidatus Levybacteria bacterium CG_4_10_14_0_2_um_filter_36_16]|nr:MAG: hypothetical protein AUK12_02035 [Candidatus Levybacteria bacterium CG2_30_37_29]PIR79471.1 MAG: hypothetical protein COU26_00945 [Candidatus Levybacteria bacterium CG10_big_fil_rev_8_21_14_0_10_36_30]PIZ96687.1 MAG: hypothetical protein COX79_04685 [Candidatus Levybacteria bacterium CG_4_10_14_0_2_um_filter_36_16]PJA90364.1 MAG: hypothetical protein CO136_02350 [Candidatus Levybacteria bacterium CG_4_9_14_3_um_filter_36_7]
MNIQKIVVIFFVTLFFATFLNSEAYAQMQNPFVDLIPQEIATQNAQTASTSAEFSDIKKSDVTKPEGETEKKEVFTLFNRRPEKNPNFINFIAYSVQFAVRTGVPANTVLLILLMPLLATIIVFFRHVVGLPSLDMLVPIALSITLLATGIGPGIVLLAIIVIASTLARLILKKVRIMQLPKLALSVLIVAISVFAFLTLSTAAGLLNVSGISIFPILLLIILSERIISLQLERTINETFSITAVTLSLGIVGYFLLSSDILRKIVLLYPEVILILIPINVIIGRYFGLRVTEYFRFSKTLKHDSH